jgi:hypothetical protein
LQVRHVFFHQLLQHHEQLFLCRALHPSVTRTVTNRMNHNAPSLFGSLGGSP